MNYRKFLIIILYLIIDVNILIAQSIPQIINYTHVLIPKEIIKEIILISNKKGIKSINKIEIGQLVLPLGLNPNVVTVNSNDYVYDSKVEKKILVMKFNYFKDKSDRLNLELSHRQLEFKVQYILTYWRIKIKSDTVDVLKDSSINYQEAESILNIFDEGKYSFVNNSPLNLEGFYKEVHRIRKVNNIYIINGGVGNSLSIKCLRYLNSLFILDESQVFY